MDWIYACLSLLGQYFTGRKRWYGWLIQMAGQVVVGIISYNKGLHGMVVLAVALNMLYGWNLYKWQRGTK